MVLIRKDLCFENIIVPLNFANIILKARNRKNGSSFQAGCSNNILFLKTKDLILFCRVIDGEFPDDSQVISNDYLRICMVDRSRLSRAIRRIISMSGKNYKMKFEFWPSSFTLSFYTPDLGQEAKNYFKKLFSVGKKCENQS